MSTQYPGCVTVELDLSETSEMLVVLLLENYLTLNITLMLFLRLTQCLEIKIPAYSKYISDNIDFG